MSAFSPLLFALLSVSSALSSAVLAVFTGRFPGTMRWLVIPLFALSGLCALVSGLCGLSTMVVETLKLPFGLPWLSWQVRLDALASFFLCVIGIVVFAVGLFAPGYVREFEHGRHPLPVLGIFTGLFLAGMLLVVLADGVFLFLVAWELMSLSSYFLVAFQHEQAANRRAAYLYLLMAHIAGLTILLGFGVLAAFADGFSFETLRQAQIPPWWADAAFMFAFAGFGMKAGLVPLHAWLPEAHPAAPSHISALMSAVMLKVAVYGFIRFSFDLLGQFQNHWGVTVLLVGSVSALLGVLYALMQHDLKRLLAYHSVENIGIIFIGLGLALIFMANGHNSIGALAFIAALYHTINHALFKALLFLGAGAVVHASHERNLNRMGGLLRRMPWTGLLFLVGCVSISALPPFNGFVSEWLTFQVALQSWSLHSGVMRSLIPVSAAMLALTGALAAACFVKVYGVAFLGQARTRHVRRAREVSPGMRAGQVLLALLCLVLGVIPAGMVQLLEGVSQQLLGYALPQASVHGLWLTPVSPQTASYAAPVLLVVLVSVWLCLVWMFQGGKTRKRRRDAWDCGFSPPNARMQYSASSFAQPIRRVFGPLFRIDSSIDHAEDGHRRHNLVIEDRLWHWLYTPVARTVDMAARRITALQSGSVRVYLGWSFATLLILLWIIS